MEEAAFAMFVHVAWTPWNWNLIVYKTIWIFKNIYKQHKGNDLLFIVSMSLTCFSVSLKSNGIV